jgi:hypothetical protein
MMEAMFGNQGALSVYMAPVDKNTVIGAYVSKARLAEAIKAVAEKQPQLSEDPAVAKTLAMLPEGSQWVALWSPQGTRELIVRMIGVIEPNIRTQVPEMPGSSPVGMSAELSPGVLDTAVVIPLDTMEAVGVFIRQMIAGSDPGAAL